MITDSQLNLSVSQAVTTTAVSGNTLDLVSIRDTGAGEEFNAYVNVEVAPTAAGAATVNFQLITSATANLASPTILGQTDAIPIASLTLGAQVIVPLPRSFINKLGQRYLGLQYTIGTGPLTAGQFSAGLILDAPDNTAQMKKTYPAGYVVK